MTPMAPRLRVSASSVSAHRLLAHILEEALAHPSTLAAAAAAAAPAISFFIIAPSLAKRAEHEPTALALSSPSRVPKRYFPLKR